MGFAHFYQIISAVFQSFLHLCGGAFIIFAACSIQFLVFHYVLTSTDATVTDFLVDHELNGFRFFLFGLQSLLENLVSNVYFGDSVLTPLFGPLNQRSTLFLCQFLLICMRVCSSNCLIEHLCVLLVSRNQVCFSSIIVPFFRHILNLCQPSLMPTFCITSFF